MEEAAVDREEPNWLRVEYGVRLVVRTMIRKEDGESWVDKTVVQWICRSKVSQAECRILTSVPRSSVFGVHSTSS